LRVSVSESERGCGAGNASAMVILYAPCAQLRSCASALCGPCALAAAAGDHRPIWGRDHYQGPREGGGQPRGLPLALTGEGSPACACACLALGQAAPCHHNARLPSPPVPASVLYTVNITSRDRNRQRLPGCAPGRYAAAVMLMHARPVEDAEAGVTYTAGQSHTRRNMQKRGHCSTQCHGFCTAQHRTGVGTG
jgi:hypothetical protein